MTYPANNGSVTSPTPQFSDREMVPSRNLTQQKTYQDGILNGGINRVTSDVTGVTLSFTGQVVPLRLKSGQYTLSFIQSTKMLSIGDGAGVDVTAGGTFTLISASGTKVTAVVVALSLPAGDESDTVVVNRGIGKESKQILWNQVPDAKTVMINGTMFLKGNTDKVISQPINVTGVNLVFLNLNETQLTDQQILEVGLQTLTFTASGTLLNISGGADVNVGAGGEFMLTSPSGTKVKAIVAAASLPVGDEADRVLVGNYADAGSKIMTDAGFLANLENIYDGAL